MIDIAKFQSVAASAGRHDVALRLTENNSGLSVTGNVFVRWIKSMSASRNREVSGLFIDALKKSYGDQVTSQVLAATNLGTRLERGKPLNSRKVMEALHLAAEIKQQFVSANQGVASSYVRPLATGFNTTPLDVKFDHLLGKLLGSKSADTAVVKANFDFEKLNQKVKEGLEHASKGGRNFVTSEKADQLIERLMLKQIGEIYRALLMEKLDITKEGSLSQRALSRNNPDIETGFTIDLSDPKSHALQQKINQQFADKVSDLIYRKLNDVRNSGSGEASIAVPDKVLNQMAEEIVGEIAGERFAAAGAARQLPVDDLQVKKLMIQEILYGSMPARMMPGFCKVYPRLSENFLELGKNPRPPPAELEQALIGMHDAVMESTRVQLTPGPEASSGVPDAVMESTQGQRTTTSGTPDTEMQAEQEEPRYLLTPDNRDAIMRSFWQAFLAGHDKAQLQGVADQMRQAGSPLRYFGQGAHYFRYDFTQSDVFEKQKEKYAPSVMIAGQYDFLLNNLAQVLQDKTGELEPLVGISSGEMLSDEAITMLRNVGIVMPAPNRVGEENRSLRLSDQALKVVQEQISLQGQSKAERAVTSDGISREFTIDLGRAVYRLQGKNLGTDPQSIIAKLREFCTDESGKLNKEMLLAISKVAYQVTFGSLMSILYPGNEHLSPFQAVPSKEGGVENVSKLEYNIGKNDQGEVTISMRFSEPVHQLDSPDLEVGISSTAMRPDVSRFGMALDISLKAGTAGTFEPVLDEASMDYAFYPQRYVSEYNSD